MKKLTFKQIRNMFWDDHPEFKADRRSRKTQNDYYADIRCSFVQYVDYLLEDGQITEKQAYNITL